MSLGHPQIEKDKRMIGPVGQIELQDPQIALVLALLRPRAEWSEPEWTTKSSVQATSTVRRRIEGRICSWIRPSKRMLGSCGTV